MWIHLKNPKFVRGLNATRRGLSTFLDLKPLNSRISSLMRIGHVVEAEDLFDEMPQRSTVTYNTMIRGYFENGFHEKAVFLYSQMPARDTFTSNTMIAGLLRNGDVEGAREIFESANRRDLVTWNSMISGYFANGRVDDAMRLFDTMPLKDVVSWNSVISGLIKVREFDKAEEMFRRMKSRDTVSWTIMLKAYLESGRISEAKQLFSEIPVKDRQAWNTMLRGCVQNNCIEIAEALFQRIPTRDLNSWSVMLEGYLSSGRANDALKLFDEMPEKLEKPWNSIISGFVKKGSVTQAHSLLEKRPLETLVSWTSVMDGYFRIGEVSEALKVFESMPVRDTAIWNAAMFGLGENDLAEEGIKLLIRMKETGLPLDESTITSFLTLCLNLQSLNLGKQMHAEAAKLGMDGTTPVNNAFITMYCRCGGVDSALLKFDLMPCRDIISWNSVICGLAHHGHGRKAVEIFEKMRASGVKPNQITFVGVLSGCSHAGLVEMGKFYFQSMRNEHGFEPKLEHYTCLVDLLGRGGLLDEAVDVVNQMKLDGVDVGESIWGALFGASRVYNNMVVAEIAGENILELDASNSGVYTVLAEMYLGGGRNEEGYGMWNRMKQMGVKKQPGCSWIESGGNGQVFLSGDGTHPEFLSISLALDLIYWEIGLQNDNN